MDTKSYYEGTIQGDTPVEKVSGKAGYDTVVTVNSSTKKVIVATAGIGNGVLVNATGETAGDSCVVQKAGRCKLLMNENVGTGVAVTSRGTDGAGKVAGSGDIVIGVTANAALAGQLVDIDMPAVFVKYLAAP